MGNKYIIDYRNYNDKFCREYQTNSFIKLVFKLFKLKRRYECINITIRK